MSSGSFFAAKFCEDGKAMRIDRVVVRQLRLEFKNPFRTSFGLVDVKDFLLVELYDSEGFRGIGECSALGRPWYNEETTEGAKHIITEFLVPELLRADDIAGPESFFEQTSWIRRNRMARAAVDCALWDLAARRAGVPEWKLLGGTKQKVQVGVSLGIAESPAALLKTVEKSLLAGYARVKCKIRPGADYDYLAAVRKEFGDDLLLMADANSAYTLSDIDLFKKMDDLHLLMIEQPLASDDIVDHRHLQAAIKTPVCLDESVDSTGDARKAIELGSCRVINIKVARVGGLTEARKLQAFAAEKGVGCWSGGMVDAGVARGHNIAAATLPNYIYPNDIPSSDRYYDPALDIVTPSTYAGKDGFITAPDLPGTGFEPNWGVIESRTAEKREFVRK